MSIDIERWRKLSIEEQMANISSEVGRAINSRDDPQRCNGAIRRAVDLFSLTAKCHSGNRLQEILRARDEFLRLFYDGSKDFEAIERYFHWFALLVRNKY